MEHDMNSTAYCDTSDKDSHVFSIFLRNARQHHDLSQEQFCLYLREQSSLFYNLDTITVSRWEREINIPSLAKQAEIVELFGEELFDLYGNDQQFITESLNLIDYPADLKANRSAHPYYCDQEYSVEQISVDHHNYRFFMNMILQYEGNPCIEDCLDNIGADLSQPLRIQVAYASGKQGVGHCLYTYTSSHELLKLLNCESGLQQVLRTRSKDADDCMLILSSFGASTQIENTMMSVCLNKFAFSKKLKYLCFSLRNDRLIKKLTIVKLTLFKKRSCPSYDAHVTISSFLISRSEVMANRFLLKLAVISSSRLKTLLKTIANREQSL